jgi:hypothetical protein
MIKNPIVKVVKYCFVSTVQTLMLYRALQRMKLLNCTPPTLPLRRLCRNWVRVGGGSIWLLKYSFFKNLIWARVLCR